MRPDRLTDDQIDAAAATYDLHPEWLWDELAREAKERGRERDDLAALIQAYQFECETPAPDLGERHRARQRLFAALAPLDGRDQ